jgi:CheY-like chemotaxis protein
MSLVGNLEELGLGEILQIVSLSRKTGVLSLSSKGRDGSVFFRQGEVVRAASSSYQHSLGELLIQKGFIDPAMLCNSLALQQENGFRELLGVILVKNFHVSQDIIEEVVREQIENVVFSLFAWGEGTYKFEVRSSIEAVDGIKMDPMQFMLDQGLNPQFLAMEGTRIQDKIHHVAEAESAGGGRSDDAAGLAFNLADGSKPPAAHPQLVKHQIVIVDDDGPTLRAVAEGLTKSGFIVHAMTSSEDTLVKVDSLRRDGERPAVLIDMIMPKTDGSGVLGGIELLELLHNNFKELQLIVMSDYHHAESEKKIRELGALFVIKPRRVEINTPAILNSFIARVTDIVGHSSKSETAAEWQ